MVGDSVPEAKTTRRPNLKPKPLQFKEPIFVQPKEFTHKEAASKVAELQSWVKKQPPATLSYSKAAPTPARIHVTMLVTLLSSITWLLNFRGADIPFNPPF